MRPKWLRFLMVSALVLVAALVASGCSINDQTVAPGSDRYACVYDGSNDGSHALKFQLPPGSNSRKTDMEDEVVYIPASNRFYYMSEDGTRRDPGAPHFLRGFANGRTPVHGQGQLRFKFNLSKACEWYAKHGRRNLGGHDTLGFNARGSAEEVATFGWFRHLAENFGSNAGRAFKQVVSGYQWPALTYSYDVNADENGILPQGSRRGGDTNDKLGREVGAKFTELLDAGLGGKYFCGVDQADSNNPCPPINFQVDDINPEDKSLEEERAKFEKTKQQLENAKSEGALQEQQKANIVKSEKTQRSILREKLKTADLQAQIDTAKCRAMHVANPRLDCEGKALPVAGGGVTVQQGAGG